MIKKIFLTACAVLSVIVVTISYVYSAENTFQVQLTIGPDDVTNPTVPTGLVATAVSSSQINLSWNASTDDIGVAGYRIFRDTIVFASTTLLSYSDTGLTASTTYEYTVEAFDATFKYSGQSATATATTSGITITPPEESESGTRSGSRPLLQIIRSTIVPTQDSGFVSFTTNYSTQAKVYWGTTPDYELGSISGLFYDFSHSVKIDTLNPNTTYFYMIEVIDNLGVTKSFESSFQTQSVIEESLLTNVTNFRAIPQQNSIALSWNNPVGSVFDSVRIVRSDKFFPRDPLEGEVVYEGTGEDYVDSDVEIGVMYYYSIFTKGIDNSYSSGALAQAKLTLAGEVAVASTSDPFIDVPVLENVHPEIERLALIDFDFFQSAIRLVNMGTGVIIDGSKNLTVSLGYDKVPEILKTIAVTLVDPDDSTKVFSFLLRVNKSKTAYEATLAPLGKDGIYKMRVTILDYKNQGLKKMEGSLKSFVFNEAQGLDNEGKTFTRMIALIAGIIPIILVVLAVRRNRRRMKA